MENVEVHHSNQLSFITSLSISETTLDQWTLRHLVKIFQPPSFQIPQHSRTDERNRWIAFRFTLMIKVGHALYMLVSSYSFFGNLKKQCQPSNYNHKVSESLRVPQVVKTDNFQSACCIVPNKYYSSEIWTDTEKNGVGLHEKIQYICIRFITPK